MPQPKKELFDYAVNNGLYQGTYGEFASQFGTDEGMTALHGALSEMGHLDMDMNSFQSSFFDAEKKNQYDDSFLPFMGSASGSTQDQMGSGSSDAGDQYDISSFMPFSGNKVESPYDVPGAYQKDGQWFTAEGRPIVEGGEEFHPIDASQKAGAGIGEWAARSLADVFDDYFGGVSDEDYERIGNIQDPAERKAALVEARIREGSAVSSMLSQALDNVSDQMKEWKNANDAYYTETDGKKILEMISDGQYSTVAAKIGNEASKMMTEIFMFGKAAKALGASAGLSTRAAAAGLTRVGATGMAARVGGLGIVPEIFGISSYNSSYEENLDTGMGRGLANVSNAAIKGMAETAGEMVTLGILDKALSAGGKGAATQFMKDLVVSMMEEGAAEGATEIVQTGVDMLMRDGEHRPSIKDLVDNTIEATLLGALTGGVMSGGASIPAHLRKNVQERTLTKMEREAAVSAINNINLINAEIEALENEGLEENKKAIEELNKALEQNKKNLAEISQMSHDRMMNLNQDDLKALTLKGRAVREAKHEINVLDKLLEAEKISQEEYDSKKKEAVVALDNATQDESQLINKLIADQEYRQAIKKIHGYDALPGKGKPVEYWTEEEIAEIIKVKKAVTELEALGEDVDAGAEGITIEGEQAEEAEVTQEELDALIDEGQDELGDAIVEATEDAEVEVEDIPEVEAGPGFMPAEEEAPATEDITEVEAGPGFMPAEEAPATEAPAPVAEAPVPAGEYKDLGTRQVAIRRDDNGKVNGIKAGNSKAIKLLQDTIAYGKKEFGTTISVYDFYEIEDGFTIVLADRSAKLEQRFYVNLKTDTVHMLGRDAKMNPMVFNLDGSYSTGEGAHVAMIGAEQAFGKHWSQMQRDDYNARFGDATRVVDGVDLGANARKWSEINSTLQKIDLKGKVVDFINGKSKSKKLFSDKGSKRALKKGTVLATVNQINVGQVKIDGKIDETQLQTRSAIAKDFIMRNTTLFRNNNVVWSISTNKRGDLLVSIEAVVPASYKKAAKKLNDSVEERTQEKALALVSAVNRNKEIEDVSSFGLKEMAELNKEKYTQRQKVENMAKSLKAMFPDLEVVMVDSYEEAKKVYPNWKSGQQGVAISKGRYTKIGGVQETMGTPERIIVRTDLTNADQVLSHEIWHMILGKMINKNAKLMEAFANSVAMALNDTPKGFLMSEYLDYFAFQDHYRRHGKAVSYEEYIVEFAGLMTFALNNADDVQWPSYQRKYMNAINTAASQMLSYALGSDIKLEEVTPTNFVEYIGQVNRAMLEGSENALNESTYEPGGLIDIEGGIALPPIQGPSSSSRLVNESRPSYAVPMEGEVEQEIFSEGDVEVMPFMADRMATGTYTGLDPESGINIPMQGGIGCPMMKDFSGKAGWFVDGGAIAGALQKRLNAMVAAGKRALGMPVLMDPYAHLSNKTMAMIYMAEMEHLIETGKFTEEEIVEKLNTVIAQYVIGKKDLSQKWGITIDEDGKVKITDKNKNAQLRAWAIDTTEEGYTKNIGGKEVPVKFVTFEPMKVKSLSEWYDIMMGTFDTRKGFMGAIHGGKEVKDPGKKARDLGLPDIAKIAEMTSDPRFKGVEPGIGLSVIEFKGTPTKTGGLRYTKTAQEAGTPRHLSYEYAMAGKSLGWLKEPVHVFDMEPVRLEDKPNPEASINFVRKTKEGVATGKISPAVGRSNYQRHITMAVPSFTISSNQVNEIEIPSYESFSDNAGKAAFEVFNADKGTETGATFNIDGSAYTGGGLAIPVTSKQFTNKTITVVEIHRMMEEHKAKFGSDIVKLGIYKFPDSDRIDIDINIVVPSKYRRVALKFGKLAGQESLFDFDTFENVKTGAKENNPVDFTDEEFNIISQALANGKMPDVRDFKQKKSKEELMKESLDEILAKGEVSEKIAATIYAYMKGAIEMAKKGKGNQKQFLDMVTTMLTEIAERNPDVEITPEDVTRIMKRASRVAVTGVKSIAAFDRYLNRFFDRASVATQKKAAKAMREAAREKAKDAKALRDLKDEFIKIMKLRAKRGEISLPKLNAILKRFNGVRLDNPKSIDSFWEYFVKVVADAEFAAKMSEARVLQAKIRQAKKSGQIQASTRAIASAFAKIDPRKVDDIEEYLDLAKQIEDAIRNNKFVGFTEEGDAMVTIKDVLKHGPINEYIESQLEEQKEMKRQDLMARYTDLMIDGVIDEGMTLEEIEMAVAESESEIRTELKAKRDAAINKYLDKMLEYQKNRLDEALITNIDPETGEMVSFTEAQKQMFDKFFKKANALESMTIKEKYKMLESMDNFFANGVTDGVRALIAGAIGRSNGNNFKKQATPIKSAFGEIFESPVRWMQSALSSLPIAGSRIFNGVKEWNEVMRVMGLSEFTRGTTRGSMEVAAMVKEYAEMFKNIDGFMTARNIAERAVLANALRNVMSGNANQNIEFKRRKKIMEESIETGKKSSDKNIVEQAKLAEEAYNEYIKDFDTYEEFYNSLTERAENDEVLANNIKGVEFWQGKWAATYDAAAAISREVYDTILDQDVSYTPDRMIRVDETGENIEDFDSGFFGQEYVPTERAGTMMQATKPKTLPEGRMLSFDFDSNMAAAMENALVDIYTAESTRQVKEFLKTKGWKDSFNNPKDEKMFREKIISYMKRAKGIKQHGGDKIFDTNHPVFRTMNRAMTTAQTLILSSLGQPVKQVIPVIFNTYVNSGKIPMMTPGSDANLWLSKQPYSINMRGAQAQVDVDKIHAALQKESEKFYTKPFEAIEKVAELKVKYLVEHPDVWVARASWLSYYENFLEKKAKENDEKFEDIDWNNHKLDTEAADYAQAMVDRQQNISDMKQAGELYHVSSAGALARRLLMPFSSFIINQKQRMWSDIAILKSQTSSLEEKARAAQSLSGATTELATFALISTVWGAGASFLYALAAGDDDETAKERFFDKLSKWPDKIKGALLLESQPLPPLFDGAVKALINKLNKIATGDPKTNLIYEKPIAGGVEGFFEQMTPTAHMAYKRYSEIGTVVNQYITGNFTEEKYGREVTKYYTEEQREKLLEAAIWMTSAFVLPEESYRCGQSIHRSQMYGANTEGQHFIEKARSSDPQDRAEAEQYRRDKLEQKRERLKEKQEKIKEEQSKKNR